MLEVELDGDAVAFMACVMTPCRLAGKPSRVYYSVEGYRDCGFDPAILRQPVRRSMEPAQQEHEAGRQFAVRRIRENGEECLFRMNTGEDCLNAALRLRNHLLRQRNDSSERFRSRFSSCVGITLSDFDAE